MKIDYLRTIMRTNPKEKSELKTEFYEGVRGISVELLDYPNNPYVAIFDMAASTWGDKIHKWDSVTPEARFWVVKSVLEFKSLPNAMESISFTFAVENCSRSAFDQIARARIGATFACLYSGKHLVYTSKGWRMIKEIEIGDLVLTHRGRFRPVTQTFKAMGSERYQVIFASSGLKVSVTPEHPFLVVRENKEDWIKAKDLCIGDQVKVLAGGRCEVCNKLIPMIKYKTNRFCSSSCQRKWWMTTEEAADKNAWFKEIQDPNQMTKPEKVVAGLLRHLGKSFEYGYRVKVSDGFRFIDFAFPEQKIGIEVHGFLTSRIKDEFHIFDIAKQYQRNEELKSLGWKIIYLYEEDLVDKIDETLKHLGIELEQISLQQNERHQYDFTTLRVKEIKYEVKRNRYHYNLEVEEDNSYVAAGLVMHNSMGWRDNDHSDIGFRVPQKIWDDSEALSDFMNTCLLAKSNYHKLVTKGQSSWQDARAFLPISALHWFSMSMNYMALRNFSSKRLKFCEQSDTVAVAWLIRERMKERFPLLASYLRPNCDFKGTCEYHREYVMSEAFGCLFKECGRNKCLATDDYATFNFSCSDKDTIAEQLNIIIPGSNENLPIDEYYELSSSDKLLFES